MNQIRVRPIRRPASSESRRSDNHTPFYDHRKRLQDVIERMELEYDKALLILHPLGITASSALYNQMIASNEKIPPLWPLYLAWIAWCPGISLTLGSFRTSIFANAKALDEYDSTGESDHKSGIFLMLTQILNWSSGILFVLGVILSALFLSRTL